MRDGRGTNQAVPEWPCLRGIKSNHQATGEVAGHHAVPAGERQTVHKKFIFDQST